MTENAGLFLSFGLWKKAGVLVGSHLLTPSITENLVRSSAHLRQINMFALIKQCNCPCSRPLLCHAIFDLTIYVSESTNRNAPASLCLQSGRPVLLNALAGGGSGACVSLLLTPIELVKCQLQVCSSEIHNRTPNSNHSSHSFAVMSVV